VETIDAFVGPKDNPVWDIAKAKLEFGDRPPLIPRTVADITTDTVNSLIARVHSGVKAAHVEVINTKVFGTDLNEISTSNRIRLRVHYTPDTENAERLPSIVILKLARTDINLGPLYANEVRIYTRLSQEMGIEMPFCLGGAFDPESQRFVLLLNDLTACGVRFPSIMDEVSEPHVVALVEEYAKLHARYWESLRFRTELANLETHVEGPLSRFMNFVSPLAGGEALKACKFKRELFEDLGVTADDLIRGTRALQRYQAKLPQTLCHGDAHLANTYIYPDGRVGLCDWQLAVRGYGMHDLSYIIMTSLSTGQRRKMERDLLKHYRDRLAALGVRNPPTEETLWNEYRRAGIWNLWVGWVGTPIVNYGWEINVMYHMRLGAALRDLETMKLVKEVL
jgi:hypothetical protein